MPGAAAAFFDERLRKKRLLAAAAAFSDSMPLAMGMRMRASALRSTSSETGALVADRGGPPAGTNRPPRGRGAAVLHRAARGRSKRECDACDLKLRGRIESEHAREDWKMQSSAGGGAQELRREGVGGTLMPEAVVAAPVAPKAQRWRRMVRRCRDPERRPGRPAGERRQKEGPARNRRMKSPEGETSAATPCGCSVSARPSKRRSVVRRMGKPFRAVDDGGRDVRDGDRRIR